MNNTAALEVAIEKALEEEKRVTRLFSGSNSKELTKEEHGFVSGMRQIRRMLQQQQKVEKGTNLW